jgi:peptidyl-prolyl cis-trans isomerase B (cyclophilin B)
MTYKIATPGSRSAYWSVIRNSSFVIRISLLLLIPLLLALSGCARHEARIELQRIKYFAEILKRQELRSIGEDRFFEENLFSNRFPEVRQWCAIALGRIQDPKALPLLYRAIHTGDAAVRTASAFAIGEIEDRDLLQKKSVAPDPGATAELSRLLDDSSISVRMRAIEALGKIGSHAEAAEIIRRLKQFTFDDSPEESAYLGFAITALARLKDPAAAPLLEKLAVSADPDIHERASGALAQLQTQTSKPESTEPPQDSDSEIGAMTDAEAYSLAAFRKNSTIARIETARGPMEILLFREDAPVTVSRFVLMASRGLYNGAELARDAQAQAIEGGIRQDQLGFHTIPSEVNMRPFERGSIGMAIAPGGSDSGRFFVALKPLPDQDGINTCFGRVISGMQVADRLVPGDRIQRILIIETVNSHDYQRFK